MSVIQLNPVAVSSVALLRAIRDGEWSTLTQLAEKADRKPNNITRDLAVLNKAGLLADGATGAAGIAPALSEDALAQLEAIDRAEGGQGEPGSPDGGDSRFLWQVGDIRLIRHEQIFPDHANARTDWDSDEARDELDALRQDIVQVGLLQNLVVRPTDFGDKVQVAGPDGQTMPLFTLVGGERRWRAIGLAISDDDWPRDRPIPCRVVDLDDLGHRLAALSENLQRRNLNPLEKARAFDGLAQALTDTGVEDSKVNREIADRVGVTIEHVQQHRSFLKLDGADQQRLTLPKDDPRRLSVSEARKKLATKAAEPEPVALEPLARLAWIEMTHASYLSGRYGNLWNDVVVAPDADLSPEGARLIEIGAIQFRGIEQFGEHIGRFTAKRHYDANKVRIAPAFPSDMLEGDEARNACLRAEQIAALGDAAPVWPEGGVAYATPWLAEPGELTPEGAALVEGARKAEAEREQANQAREEAAEARKARWAAARQRHIELFAEAASKPVWGVPDQTVEIAAEIDRPLPWSMTELGRVLAANGAEVTTFGHWQGCTDQGRVTARMIVAAVNAAGGLATPTAPVDEDDDEPEQAIDGSDPDAPDEDEIEEGEEAERAYAAADHEDAA